MNNQNEQSEARKLEDLLKEDDPILKYCDYLVTFNGRFYPPKEKNAYWTGTLQILVSGECVQSKEFNCETLIELKKEIKHYLFVCASEIKQYFAFKNTETETVQLTIPNYSGASALRSELYGAGMTADFNPTGLTVVYKKIKQNKFNEICASHNLKTTQDSQLTTRVIKTMKTDPNHITIGHKFLGWNGNTYLCDSWEENAGFWMTNVNDSTDRRNVSERAIGNTFHKQYEEK